MELKHDIFGLLAEFDTPEELLAAAEKVRDAGFKKADAYAPFPVHGLTEAMGFQQDPRAADRPHGRHHRRADRLPACASTPTCTATR